MTGGGPVVVSPSMKTLVGLVQMRCSDDPRKNQAAAEAGIREAAKRGARIVCLPELYRGRYFCQTEDHSQFARAEAIPGAIDLSPRGAREVPEDRDCGLPVRTTRARAVPQRRGDP